MKSEIFALVDCNNFFVSCERVFNPRLRNKPVIVLSNNDGCVIARSQEVKTLGIQMGAPLFTCKNLIKQHNIQVYSSNFFLYGDISARVMQTLQEHVPEMEIYSIDEAFLRLTNLQEDIVSFCRNLRQIVYQWTGIPVSIGIGPTKTLAKVANKVVKKNIQHQGVYDIGQAALLDDVLDTIPVEDVWGVGRRYAALLQKHRITTARQLKYTQDAWIKKRMTIAGLRTVWELRGDACMMLEQNQPSKKSIAYTRSFGKRVTEFDELQEVLAEYAAQLGYKLRKERVHALSLYVFVMTNRFTEYRYYASHVISLPIPTAFTPDLIRAAHHALKQIFKPGYIYKKAGIIALDLIDEQEHQLSITTSYASHYMKQHIMHTIDTINKKWGRRTLLFAAQGIQQSWKMMKVHRSAAYTTHWHELPIIKIR